MLAHHLGPETLAADPASVVVLLEHSGGLPLALGVLAARATAYPGFPRQCLDLRRGTGNTFQSADPLVGLGDAHHALGNDTDARAAWREALALYDSQHRRARDGASHGEASG